MLAPVQISDHIKHRACDYRALKSQAFCKLKEGNFDLCFYIPVRGRTHFFNPFYNYFKEALKKSGLSVKLVVVENDVTSNYSSLIGDKDLEYIFIPADSTKSENLFAKSACYNLGFLYNSNTPYHVFHDLDILIDNDYFNLLEVYINKGFTWLQPYTKKRVMRVGAGATGLIVNNPDKILDLSTMSDMAPANPGSPGGSILVKKEDFINVGGYDPELFFGYSPEDSFLWAKLEVLFGVTNFQNFSHFQGKAVYADDPLMEVYHLDHPIAEKENPYYRRMLEVLDSFFKISNKDRLELIELKKQIIQEALQ